MGDFSVAIRDIFLQHAPAILYTTLRVLNGTDWNSLEDVVLFCNFLFHRFLDTKNGDWIILLLL